jgi:hypothetical protein
VPSFRTKLLVTLTAAATVVMFAFAYVASLTPGEDTELSDASALTFLLALLLGCIAFCSWMADNDTDD